MIAGKINQVTPRGLSPPPGIDEPSVARYRNPYSPGSSRAASGPPSPRLFSTSRTVRRRPFFSRRSLGKDRSRLVRSTSRRGRHRIRSNLYSLRRRGGPSGSPGRNLGRRPKPSAFVPSLSRPLGPSVAPRDRLPLVRSFASSGSEEKIATVSLFFRCFNRKLTAYHATGLKPWYLSSVRALLGVLKTFFKRRDDVLRLHSPRAGTAGGERRDEMELFPCGKSPYA